MASPVFSADIEYLIIGGGGGSGCGGTTNGGGNAGQLINGTVSDLTVGTTTVSIGVKGYQDCTNPPYVGVSGTDTNWHTFTAVGGTGGTGANTTTGGDGAGANNSGCSGGVGLNLSISTTTYYYAGGGACYGAGGSNGLGYNWYGGGGDGNDGTPKEDGVLILKYLTSEVTATGGSMYTSGSYTIHVFETDDDFVITYISSSGGGTGTTTEIDWGSATTTNQMLGSINFGLAILIVFFMIGFSGYVWNKFGNKKPWLR